jgi:hypothetical protein
MEKSGGKKSRDTVPLIYKICNWNKFALLFFTSLHNVCNGDLVKKCENVFLLL